MFKPIDLASLVDYLAREMGDRTRVAVDGAPPARPERVAQALVDRLQSRGGFAIHIRTKDFLRPASIRYELGREEPDSYYERWVDLAALNREVLSKPGKVLPTLWNADTDRATRAGYVEVPPEGVIVVSGDLLLGAGLDVEMTVHLQMSGLILSRRTPPELAWTLPAYARYAQEVDPGSFADVVVRMNDPDHPALVVS
ncbi:uridine kinase [Rhizocola hellebori]|uniref:Uridine kinase n=1 Tax=Rhizocola hellebori TaxID=1392758 RepID=A0A8J3Q986_9ACTN|nr:uridine kinase [Rhizocola hellebori]GIH06255.1 uridine kinase [Rhizocola hellebori]